MNESRTHTATRSWWQPRAIEEGRSLELELGPLALKIGRSDRTWLVAVERDDSSDSAARARCRVRKRLPETHDERFVQARTPAQIELKPVMAERAVIIRPFQPIFLLGHEEVTLYLSTPISVQVSAGDPPVLLREFASQPMSDTWFGPDTRSGELCFSGRTQARHRLAELPVRPNRAITPMRIRNATETPLLLEKVKLPAPMLALYGDVGGGLWTRQVTLVREADGNLARVRIEPGAPQVEKPVTLVAEPREDPGRGNLVMRAFNVLFGE